MDTNDWRVIMTVRAKNGDRLELVVYANGDCGLIRNGLQVPDLKWGPCQMDQGTAELLRRAGLP